MYILVNHRPIFQLFWFILIWFKFFWLTFFNFQEDLVVFTIVKRMHSDFKLQRIYSWFCLTYIMNEDLMMNWQIESKVGYISWYCRRESCVIEPTRHSFIKTFVKVSERNTPLNLAQSFSNLRQLATPTKMECYYNIRFNILAELNRMFTKFSRQLA